MRYFIYFLVVLFLASCTSNTIYKKPKNLIPKDTMVLLLTDIYIASSTKGRKELNLNNRKTYMPFVYEKYKIDSSRFQQSNLYYVSKLESYEELLKKVKNRLKILHEGFRIKDSIEKSKKKIKKEVQKQELIDSLSKKNIKKKTQGFYK